MTTTVDSIREQIQERSARLLQQGGDLLHGNSERIEALWMEIDNHLKAADLCELLCEDSGLNRHLNEVQSLLVTIERGLLN